MPWIRPNAFPPLPVSGAVFPWGPLAAPDFAMIAELSGWRSGWTHIVAGLFSDSPFSGLFCYDQVKGAAAFYETDGLGNPSLLAEHDDWDTSWTNIAVGRFADSPYSGLLLYDRADGRGALYATDGQGGVSLLRQEEGWRSWTDVVPGRFSKSDYVGVLLYDRWNGFGAFYSTDGHGRLKLLREFDDWRSSWTAIVPVQLYAQGDPPYYSTLFFYEGETGYGETYGVDGRGGIMQIGAQSGLPIGARVVSGSFGGLYWLPWTNLLFLDQAVTSGQVWCATGEPAAAYDPKVKDWQPDPNAVTWYPSEPIELGSRGYDLVVPGNFWIADPEDVLFDEAGFTDLGFYGRADGELDVFLKEPPPASVQPLAGYPSCNRVARGETVDFHISSNVGPFVIDVYRLGGEERHITRLTAVGSPGPFPTPRAGWRGADWPPAASFTVPEGASGGLYVARVSTAFGTGASGGVGQLGRRAASAPVRDSEVGTTTSTHSGAGGEPSFHLVWATIDIPFIVRSPGPTAASILVSVPDTTYEAYNQWGGRSFYTHSAGEWPVWVAPYKWLDAPRAFRVSYRRGFASIDTHVGTEKWTRWEVPLLAWLERQKITVDVCAVSELHHEPDLLAGYQLFISTGHDEYWSREMRTSVKDFIDAGGNVAFLSGNTCFWQIRFEDDGDTIVCYKDAQLDPLAGNDTSRATVQWGKPPVNDSERQLTGVSGADVENPDKPEPWRTYSVKDDTHWVFTDTGLSNTDAFGVYLRPDGELRSVLGPETDWTGDGTPSNHRVLADMMHLPPVGDKARAEMVIIEGHDGRGTVFSAATIDWVLGLTNAGDTPIDHITRNVLERLGGA